MLKNTQIDIFIKKNSILKIVQLSLETEKTWLQCQCERWGLSTYICLAKKFPTLFCSQYLKLLSNTKNKELNE